MCSLLLCFVNRRTTCERVYLWILRKSNMTAKIESKKTIFLQLQKQATVPNVTLVFFILRLVIALAVTIGMFAIELAGFFSGVSMFNCSQGLLCILLVTPWNYKNK